MEQAAKYVYKVYQEQSITKAAERLFISQPALSAAIARHEKELGFQIFNRSTLPISLTPKGQIYIESLSQILAIEEETAIQLREAAGLEHQQIAIGCSSTAAYYLLAGICEAFTRSHPDVRITVDLGNNGGLDNLPQKLLRRKLDFYFCNDKPNIKCATTQLMQTPLLIAVSHKVPLPQALAPFRLSYDALQLPSSEKPVVSTDLFRDIPFVDYYAGTAMFKKMHKMLGNYKSLPVRVVNAKNAFFHYQLAKEGGGAVFLPATVAKALFSEADHMWFFYPDHPLATQEFYVCSHTVSKLSPLLQEFLHACQTYCHEKLTLSP